jgi:methylase of polypeptide subunit release factors
MSTRPDAVEREVIEFEGLSIAFDDRVLRPRAWTAEQSRWAASLLPGLPPGPVLELCAGAAQIGLAAVGRTRRTLVCVEADPVAAAYAGENARAAGLDERVEVRQERMAAALDPEEKFALVIADPPWVLRTETGRFPADPLTAIDGGVDGLSVARECVVLIAGHLTDDGAALLQLGSGRQVASLADEMRQVGLAVTELRRHVGGVVALLERASAE